MTEIPQPTGVVWDVTFACPLRCRHCYTESGRRPAKQLTLPDLLEIADSLIAMKPREISIAGGEPLLVPGIAQIARRITDAGIQASLWTSGWHLRPSNVDELADSFSSIHVSLDGATAEVHDAIRGRRRSFDKVMDALRTLDEAARIRRERDDRMLFYGIDCTVSRSNVDQLDEFCATIPAGLTELMFISFQTVLPIGLASRTGFADHEILTDEEIAVLAGPERTAELQAIAGPSVKVFTDGYQSVHPYFNDQDPPISYMEVEPDGAVRAISFCEGTIGNIRTEPAQVLWERALARRHDPFVRAAYADVVTMADWAAAVRAIDYHFASAEDRARLDARPAFLPLTPV